MGSNYENQKKIVDAWVKLEKCLDDFDAEVLDKRNRPMTGGAAPNRFQITTKRPDSSKFGPVAGSKTSNP
jgi:hypothetical protein